MCYCPAVVAQHNLKCGAEENADHSLHKHCPLLEPFCWVAKDVVGEHVPCFLVVHSMALLETCGGEGSPKAGGVTAAAQMLVTLVARSLRRSKVHIVWHRCCLGTNLQDNWSNNCEIFFRDSRMS